MKKIVRLSLLLTIVCILLCCFTLVGCGKKTQTTRTEDTVLRFSAPEGTPALAMLRLAADNAKIDGTTIEYATVKPKFIAEEMSTKKADIVIMPVNAGALNIRAGMEYKLVSIAVDGSLYMVGNTATGGGITPDDVKGKKIACIGKTGVPGLVFRYVIAQFGITIVDENTTPSDTQASVNYVAEGTDAKQLLQSGKVDFAVVGEPAATAFKKAMDLNAEMNMQTAYASYAGVENYPQAGLFVTTAQKNDAAFMNALFDLLKENKEWVSANASEVTSVAQQSLYKDANFPSISIPRCAINGAKLTQDTKQQILTFLQNVCPKDSQGTEINWSKLSEKLF